MILFLLFGLMAFQLRSPAPGVIRFQVLIPLAIVLFIFTYLCAGFIHVFFNMAITTYAADRIIGENPTLFKSFCVALKRFPHITAWTLCGLFYREMDGFFVIPVMAVEKKRAFQALKESVDLIQKNWNGQPIKPFDFVGVISLINVPYIFLIVVSIGMATILHNAVSAAVLQLSIGYIILVMILTIFLKSTFLTVFQTIVYCYARYGQTPKGVDPKFILNVMKTN